MRGVLTGDIINSREVEDPDKWISTVQTALAHYGDSSGDWEIYRGDSFQLECPAEKAFLAAFHLKAAIKSIAKLDVRISIGLGASDGGTNKSVRLRSGRAFILSGEAFDTLKEKKRSLIINSDDQALRHELDTMLLLSEGLLEAWSPSSAEAMALLLTNPGISQIAISEKLGITQPSVSARLKVAHAEKIRALLEYYTHRINLSQT